MCTALTSFATVMLRSDTRPPDYTQLDADAETRTRLVADATATLLELENDVIPTLVDKHADMYCLVCRHLYNVIGWEYFKSQPDTYVHSTSSEAALVAWLAVAPGRGLWRREATTTRSRLPVAGETPAPFAPAPILQIPQNREADSATADLQAPTPCGERLPAGALDFERVDARRARNFANITRAVRSLRPVRHARSRRKSARGRNRVLAPPGLLNDHCGCVRRD